MFEHLEWCVEQADVAMYDRMSASAGETPVGMEGQGKENHKILSTDLIHFHGLS